MKLIFKGIVQGVGFRPTIYRIAKDLNLKGYVLNKGSEVEVVIDKKTGFVLKYGEWDKMKEKIEYILDNPKKSKKIDSNARNHIKDNFEIKKIVKEYDKLYRNTSL